MELSAIWEQVLAILQTFLPGVIVVLVTGLVKKWKEKLSGKLVLGVVVPLVSFLVAIVDYLLLDANFEWTFVLGFVSVFLYEVKKQFTTSTETTK